MKANVSKLTSGDRPVFRKLVKSMFGEEGKGEKRERTGLKEVLQKRQLE